MKWLSANGEGDMERRDNAEQSKQVEVPKGDTWLSNGERGIGVEGGFEVY